MQNIDIPAAVREYVEAEQHGAGIIALNVAQAGIVTALQSADPSLSDTAAAFRFHKLVDEMRGNGEISADTLARIAPKAANGLHEFAPTSGGTICVTPCLRPDGTVQPCGDPVKGAIHDPQAYAAYATELAAELTKFAASEAPYEFDATDLDDGGRAARAMGIGS